MGWCPKWKSILQKLKIGMIRGDTHAKNLEKQRKIVGNVHNTMIAKDIPKWKVDVLSFAIVKPKNAKGINQTIIVLEPWLVMYTITPVKPIHVDQRHNIIVNRSLRRSSLSSENHLKNTLFRFFLWFFFNFRREEDFLYRDPFYSLFFINILKLLKKKCQQKNCEIVSMDVAHLNWF